MAQETLFQLLLRQPWWVTLLVAFVLFWIAYAIFPPVAPFMALPFLALSVYIAYTQWRSGAFVDVEAGLATLRAMSWEVFSAAVSDAYRRAGFTVSPADGAGYDFKLEKDGRTTLLQCRRWKVNQVGAGPVRELADAVERADAYKGICLAAGEFSAPARKLAAGEPITLVSGPELVRLLRRSTRQKRRWWP